jgi:AraC-like DNA-binding protein
MAGLDNVVSYVEKNLEGSIRVITLARLARLSPAHFSRVFTKALGVPPGRYVRLRRLQAAMTLMTSTTAPLSAIAVSSGHTDQSHLSRAFSQFVGVSPRRWRRTAVQNAASAPSSWRRACLPMPGVGVQLVETHPSTDMRHKDDTRHKHPTPKHNLTPGPRC